MVLEEQLGELVQRYRRARDTDNLGEMLIARHDISQLVIANAEEIISALRGHAQPDNVPEEDKVLEVLDETYRRAGEREHE